MIGRLHRYVLGQCALASAAAVGLFAGLLILGNALRELAGYLAGGQVAPQVLLQLVGLLVPFVLSYALPLGLLAGTLLTLGRLSAQHEITAMRAAGLSLTRIASPVLFLAVLGVAASLVVNLEYGPVARARYRAILADAVRSNPLGFLIPKTFVREFPGIVLYTGSRDGNELRDFWLWEMDARRRVTRVIRAERATLSLDESAFALDVHLERAVAEARDGADPEDFGGDQTPLALGDTSIRLPLDRLLGRSTPRRSLGHLSFTELVAEIGEARSAAGTESGTDATRRLTRARHVLQERCATAFGALSLALVAIPLGFRFKRKETTANLGVALALALSYYLLMVVIGWLDAVPSLRSDLLLWLPNLLFQATGTWLLTRADRG